MSSLKIVPNTNYIGLFHVTVSHEGIGDGLSLRGVDRFAAPVDDFSQLSGRFQSFHFLPFDHCISFRMKSCPLNFRVGSRKQSDLKFRSLSHRRFISPNRFHHTFSISCFNFFLWCPSGLVPFDVPMLI